MNIDKVNISNQGIDRSQAAQPADATRSAGNNRQVPAGSDSVALSNKAQELRRLSNNIEESRAQRLEEVRAELEAGTYQVSAEDLAKALIESNRK